MVNKHNKEILRNFKSKSDFPDEFDPTLCVSIPLSSVYSYHMIPLLLFLYIPRAGGQAQGTAELFEIVQ